MIRIENTVVTGFDPAIRGMRNPMNSWEKSDSYPAVNCGECVYNPDITGICEPAKHREECDKHECFEIGPNDLDLMKRLRNAGTDHRKFMRMITVYMDITAPLYWWKEFDTYKVGTVANSCSTMHTIHKYEFTFDDFSHEHFDVSDWEDERCVIRTDDEITATPLGIFELVIIALNTMREAYLKTKDKEYWYKMIQMLPTSYNQRRTVQLNFEVLANIYKSRRNHKLDEWHTFCDWIETLPYSELITGKEV